MVVIGAFPRVFRTAATLGFDLPAVKLPRLRRDAVGRNRVKSLGIDNGFPMPPAVRRQGAMLTLKFDAKGLSDGREHAINPATPS
jgi:hypothetical protein